MLPVPTAPRCPTSEASGAEAVAWTARLPTLSHPLQKSRRPASKMTFNSAVLDWPVKVHDPAYREILTPILEKAIELARADFTFAVHSILKSHVGDGRLTRSEVSRALGVSVHILSRRLKSAGLTFSDLAEQLKIERAESLLLKGKHIGEISSDLGFADVSSFTRAFKNRVGQSPSQCDRSSPSSSFFSCRRCSSKLKKGPSACRRIDVIVVYKVDRLTRSLADFAKLVELFDAHQASFVSVTQSFNTTTSMGRLTLNVLLSFAQFEREVRNPAAKRQHVAEVPMVAPDADLRGGKRLWFASI